MGSQLDLSGLALALLSGLSFSYFIKEIRTINRIIQPPAVTKVNNPYSWQISDSITFLPETAHVFEGS